MGELVPLKRLLGISLIPKTSWYSNVRSQVSRDVWSAIRLRVMKRSCQYCGCRYGLHCHEVWSYDENYVQSLKGFETTCFLCHAIKHLGLAGLMAKRGDLDYQRLIKHYCEVNGCTEDDFLLDREEAFELWEERSQHGWTIDISYLESLNITSTREWMKEHPKEVARIKDSYSDVITRIV